MVQEMTQYLQTSGATYTEKALVLAQLVQQLQERLRCKKEACASLRSQAPDNASACLLESAQQQPLADAATHDCRPATTKTAEAAGIDAAATRDSSYTAGAGVAAAAMLASATTAGAANGHFTQRHPSAGLGCQPDGLHQQLRGHHPDKQQLTAICFQESQRVGTSASLKVTITPQGCRQSSMLEAAAAAAADQLTAAAAKAAHADMAKAAKITSLHKAVTKLDLDMQQCKESLDALSDLLTSLNTGAAEQQTSILREHLTTADMLLHRLRQLKTCKQQVQLVLIQTEGPRNGGAGVQVAATEASSRAEESAAKRPCSGLVDPALCTARVAGVPRQKSASNTDSKQRAVAPQQSSKSCAFADCRLPGHKGVHNSTLAEDKLLNDRSTAAQRAVRTSKHVTTACSPQSGAAAPAATVTTAFNHSPLLRQDQQVTAKQWPDLHNSKKLCSKTRDEPKNSKGPVSRQTTDTVWHNDLKQMKSMIGTQARPRDVCGCDPFQVNTVKTRACVQDNLRKLVAVPRNSGPKASLRTMKLQQALAKLQAAPADDQLISWETGPVTSPSTYVTAAAGARTPSSQPNSDPCGHHDHRSFSQPSAFRSQLLELLMVTEVPFGRE